MISAYTQEWDGELSDLDVETKEVGLFDPLNLPAMPKNEGRTVEKLSGMEKNRQVPTLLMPHHNNGMQRTPGNVSQLEM